MVVAVEAVGICGSDMHAYHGHDERRPAPLVLGHEAAGRIAGGPRGGEPVTINPLVTCGHCDFCISGRAHLCRTRQIISMPPRPGAFAERVRIPDGNAIAVPEDCDMVVAALAEPMAVAWHAVRVGAARLDRPLAASRCVVLGGGAIGLASALVLRHFGARDLALAEPNALRRVNRRARRHRGLRPGRRRGARGPARGAGDRRGRRAGDPRRCLPACGAGRDDRACRPAARRRGHRHPPHHLAGDHAGRQLLLYAARFPRDGRGAGGGRFRRRPTGWSSARWPRADGHSRTSTRGGLPRRRSCCGRRAVGSSSLGAGVSERWPAWI